MKVLHIVPYFFPASRFGGPIKSLFSLCCGIAENECQIRVLTTDSNGPNKDLEMRLDRDLKIQDFFYVRYCHRLMQESVSPTLLKLLPAYINWANVVHLTAVYSFPTIPTLLVSKLLGKPVVWSPRGGLQRWSGTSKRELKAIWEKICYLVAPAQLILHVTSEEEARDSQRRFPSFNTVIVPNGVEIPEQLNLIPRNRLLRLGYLGRLNPIKGLENLLAACAKLKDKNEFPFFLTVAGSGSPPYIQFIAKEIKKLGLSAHVKMVGHVEGPKKKQLFENLDALVVPSHIENFGMVIAESLAHSIPVIASTGTPWKRVEEVGCGLWVDNMPDSLEEAITRMNQMPLSEMGKRGQKWMEEEYSWSQVAKQMKNLYKKLTVKTI